MAIPTWGMYNKRGKGPVTTGRGPLTKEMYDPDPYDQQEQYRQGPDMSINVTARRPDYDPDPYDQIGRENITTLPLWRDREGNEINQATTNNPTTTNNNSGGLMGFLQSLLGGGGLGGLGNLGSLLSSYYSSQRSADEMEEQAGRYGALGREAADRASPISNERRGEWDRRLSQLYEDPQAFLEGNPEYKANLSLGTGELAAQNAARGHNLGGKATTDQLKFLTELSSKYIGKERDDLMNMAGYQFNPAEAGRLMMEGGRLEGDARQAALAARLYPLGELSRMMSGGTMGGNTQGGVNAGGGLDQLLRMFTGGNRSGGGGGSPVNPSNIQNLLRMFGQNGPPGLQDIFGLGNTPGAPNGDWSQDGTFRPGWADAFFNGNSPLGGYQNWDWSNPALSGYNPEGIYGEGAESISNFFTPEWWTSIFG